MATLKYGNIFLYLQLPHLSTRQSWKLRWGNSICQVCFLCCRQHLSIPIGRSFLLLSSASIFRILEFLPKEPSFPFLSSFFLYLLLTFCFGSFDTVSHMYIGRLSVMMGAAAVLCPVFQRFTLEFSISYFYNMFYANFQE